MKKVLIFFIVITISGCSINNYKSETLNLNKDPLSTQDGNYTYIVEKSLFKKEFSSNRVSAYDAIPTNEMAEKIALIYYDYICKEENIKEFSVTSKLVNKNSVWKVLIKSTECSKNNSYCDNFYYYFYLKKIDGEFLLVHTLRPNQFLEKYPPKL